MCCVFLLMRQNNLFDGSHSVIICDERQIQQKNLVTASDLIKSTRKAGAAKTSEIQQKALFVTKRAFKNL